MRIAVLLDRWRHGGGGLEHYLLEVLPRLANRHEVHFLARDADCMPPSGVQPHDVRSVVPRPRPWRDFADARVQARAAASLQADRVWIPRSTPVEGALWQPHGGSGEHLQAARQRAGLPSGWRALRRLERRTLAASGGLLAVSPKVAREVASRRPELSTAVLPLPLSEDLPPLSEQGDNTTRIYFCGRDARLKGAADALRMFRFFRRHRPQASLHMWGKSPAQLARVLGHSDSELSREGVELRGWDGSFRAALPQAALLLHPTHYDSFSLVCLEAVAHGVPILTTAACGFAELAPPLWLATMNAERDPERAAEQMLVLIERARGLAPEERMAELQEIRERFSLSRHLQVLESILENGIDSAYESEA